MGHQGGSSSSLPKCLKSHQHITDPLHLCSKFATHLRVITGKVVVLRTHGYSGPGKSGSIQLCSSTQIDQGTGRGQLSEKAQFKKGKRSEHNGTSTKTYKVKFYVEPEFGIPGALIVKNRNKHEFFLYFVTLEAHDKQVVRFECNSWVYPISKTKSNRLFFSNTSYLPNKTPKALMELRKEELVALRGDGMGERKKWDRIYDYDYYNDLGNPDKDQSLVRPVLGGSQMFPYPLRGRTGRPSSNQDHLTESREETIINLDIYVPPDERFSPIKMTEFISNSIRSIVHFFVPEAKSLLQQNAGNFESLSEIRDLFVNNNRNRVIEGWMAEKLKALLPEELVKEVHRTCKENPTKFPIPQIIAANEFAWKDDVEFAREMLAGLNPAVIQCLQRFPPESKSGTTSKIRASHIEHNLEGLTLEMAMQQWRIFILDHHDYLMPFLNKINTEGVCAYASRTLLFLKNDATLKPLAIELTLPGSKEDDDEEEINRVFLPATQGTEAALWQLAKTHVVVNDSGYHQLISHWLKTHAVVEPFIIATRRQLSEMHPIHRLLHPHFKDTMHINGLARSIVLNAGGGLEKSLFTGKTSMEMTSMLYKDWRFDEQGLPADLVKRRLAIKDANKPSGVKLLFDDYPYGIDGLDIWIAIKTWVKDFCSIFYTSDDTVELDREIQAWWSEIRDVGHGDKCNEPWWYNMTTISDLVEALTTLIWISSALHASVNFGQYGYGGYPPNRPSLCRKFIPKEGTFEFADFLRDPDKYFLKMLPERIEMTLGIALLEILSKHTSDEVYLGQRSLDWTDNEEVRRSFKKFRENLLEVEKRIMARNRDPNLKNRLGPAKIPYTLLFPDTSNETSKGGLTGKGIPNSVSI